VGGGRAQKWPGLAGTAGAWRYGSRDVDGMTQCGRVDGGGTQRGRHAEDLEMFVGSLSSPASCLIPKYQAINQRLLTRPAAAAAAAAAATFVELSLQPAGLGRRRIPTASSRRMDTCSGSAAGAARARSNNIP